MSVTTMTIPWSSSRYACPNSGSGILQSRGDRQQDTTGAAFPTVDPAMWIRPACLGSVFLTIISGVWSLHFNGSWWKSFSAIENNQP